MTNEEIIRTVNDELKSQFYEDGEIEISYFSMGKFANDCILRKIASIEAVLYGRFLYCLAEDKFYYEGEDPEFGGGTRYLFEIKPDLLFDGLKTVLKRVATTELPETIYFSINGVNLLE